MKMLCDKPGGIFRAGHVPCFVPTHFVSSVA